ADVHGRSRSKCYRFVLPVGCFGGNRRSQAVDSKLAAPQGFEPRYADPESAVLPLNEGATSTERKRCAGLILWAAFTAVNTNGPAKLALVRAFRQGRISIWKIAYGCSRECQSDHQRIQRSRAPCFGCPPMRAHRGRYPGEASARNSAERAIAQELATAEPLGWDLENSHANEHAVCEGIGRNGIRNCLPTAGRAGCRQTSILLLRQRCLLLHAETAAWQSQHSSALWDGKPHLRDANGSGRLARWLPGARGIRCGRFTNGVELEDRPRTDARCWRHHLFDRNDGLRIDALFRNARV